MILFADPGPTCHMRHPLSFIGFRLVTRLWRKLHLDNRASVKIFPSDQFRLVHAEHIVQNHFLMPKSIRARFVALGWCALAEFALFVPGTFLKFLILFLELGRG